MINMSLFIKKLFLLLLIIVAGLSLSVEAKANSKHVTDSVLTKLMQYPESISSYSIEELTKDMDEERIRQWCNIIISLKADGISRNVVKRYYFPLCRSIIESFYHESEMLHEMTHNRSFPSDIMMQTDSVMTGRDIISRFMEYQHVCMAMMELPWDFLIVPVCYGNMRMVESFIWGDNKYMDNLDPIPDTLITNINNLFDVKIFTFEKDLYRLILPHSQDWDFLTDNAILLLDASTYLSQYQMKMVAGTVSTAYTSQGKIHELFDIMNSLFSKRWGREFWNKLKPIITYRITGVLEIEKVKTFQHYRDSLLSKHIEVAKYYPHQCPDDMKQSIAYEEYNNKFYDALDYIFATFIKESSVSQLPLGSQFFHNIGCSSQEEFLRIYTKETLRRYYDNDDFLMWGKIEKIREYLENSSKYPIDVALHIVESYGPINALKARDFIHYISLTTWIDKQMMASQQDVNELGLRAASVIAYVYASLYNDMRYPVILKYVEWVKKNIERAKDDKDGIVYNIASALALMDKHKESLDWISKVRVDKSEYKQEFYRLLLENHCELDNTKETIKFASKMDNFSYQDILRLIRIKLKEGKIDGLEDLLSIFTSSLSYDFNVFSFMDFEDQDWSSRIAKYRTKNLWMDIDISLWIEGEKSGKQVVSSFEPYIAAMRYNWALASKGVLLRSNKFMRELILNKMSAEQYWYYQHALDFEDDDYQDDNLNRRLDSFVSEQSKAILLDYVRKDTTYVLPQYDYTIVRNQLQTGDIAIELVRLDDDLFDVVMIRKDWDYPKQVSIVWSDKENNSKKLWSSLMPYIKKVQRIFISLDGEYNFENIELVTDSTGECMADKYNIYRVSTTLNIPKDVYISDIKQSVLYGNLKYADSDETDSHEINENVVSTENNKRGAINDYWIPLEDTKEELKAICNILSDMNIQHKEFQEEYGDKMSFMSLNRQKIDLLHLATHGFYYDEDLSDEDKTSAMKRSGIVLSNSAYDLLYKKQSGSIFANEIANMDLNSIKLLVLSACETAQGNLGDDGVFGLQRGFKQAGVGCMIMSLKEVNSSMTTELMQLFYSFFAKGQSVREAFRNAQIQIAGKYKIDDWKAFVIID